MARRHKRRKLNKWLVAIIAISLVWGIQESRFYFPRRVRPPKGMTPIVVEMETTSYCHCRRCCSYKWMLFIPYQKRGRFKYRIKHVGITSSGSLARPGTLAADTSIYPYGTIMHIPGYGYGRVEDTGGAIKEHHIDLYRPNHWFARLWGVRAKKVQVWLPQETAPAKATIPTESELPEPPEQPGLMQSADLPDEG